MEKNGQEKIQVGLQITLNTWDDMLKEGVAELRLLDDSKFKEQNIMFRSFYNQNTGVTWGVPIRVHQNGDIQWKPINLKGTIVRYNLKNPSEAQEFHVIKNSPFVQGSPLANIDVRYKVYDVEQEALAFVDETEKMISAVQFINNMDHNKLIAFGPLYGISPDTNSPAVIRKALLQKAKMDPKSILSKKEKESETAILITMKRAERVGMVKVYPDRGIIYNENISLGYNENAAVEYLRNNPNILVDMDRAAKEKDTFYTSISATQQTEKSYTTTEQTKGKSTKKIEEDFA